MNSLNKKQKIIIIFISVIITSVFCYYIYSKEENLELVIEENKSENITVEEIKKETKVKVIVHVAGAVNNEGIIELEQGNRISDAIEKAGGLKQNADLSQINLAYIPEDGEKIYIPTIGEKENTNIQENQSLNRNQTNKSKKVNINTASQSELETLTGIGPSIALKIVEYRKENGKFSNIEQLKEVGGIGEKKFEKIKNEIEV